MRILAEQDAALPLDLPATVTLEWLRCETDQPVDDALVRSSTEGFLFVQAKHSVELQTKPDSEFASVIDQFVRQYLAVKNSASMAIPSGRQLDPDRDRLVFATSSESSLRVRRDLPNVLRRIRQLTPQKEGGTLESVASNATERHALGVVRDHVVRSWRTATGSDPTDREIADVLELTHVLTLDLDPGETDEREARSILRASILEDPVRADAAWDTLIATCALRAKGQSGIDRIGLQQLLIGLGHDLRAARSFRRDIERLQQFSRSILDQFAPRATIDVGITKVKIARPCTAALVAAAPEGSLLVVGEPGSGKSIALHEAVQQLMQLGHDVVYLAADSLAAESLGEMRLELNLGHELGQVLSNWPGAACGFLVIDALDAARTDGSGKALRDLIGAVIRSPGRWRVMASIREFDLRYGGDWQRLFRGAPIQGYAHPQFGNVRQLLIPRLDDGEIWQVRSQAPELGALIDGADEKLGQLLRVAFNLRLMGELLGGGIPPAYLTPIRTQLELLDRYWLERVVGADRQGDAREVVLRRASEAMVAGRSLRANRRAVTGSPADSAPLDDLLSCGVLVEWQSPRSSRPDRDFLAYSHHVLHDYAIARTLLRGEAAGLIGRLGEEPDLAMSIRPSLVMHYQHLWSLDPDHQEFWHLSKQVQRDARVPEIAKTISASVAADLLDAPSDFDLILAELGVRRGE